MAWKNGRTKPVIGIVGGIGSGKSAVSRLFEREGCAVIDSDALSHAVLQTQEVKAELRQWLGDSIFDDQGRVIRKAVAAVVFGEPEKVQHLNAIVHPKVGQRRDELMAAYLHDPALKAIVWDTPLLVESGLDRECDAVVFVKVSLTVRLKRIKQSRGWPEEEVLRREKLQIGLDKKAALADYYVDNSGDEVASLLQVQRVLSHLFQTARP